MRIHHLNCGSLCPLGGRLLGGAGGFLSPAPMCCHCLLIEGDDRLILVDTGLGVEDVNEPRRLGHLFNLTMRPRLEVAETALRQVADLGYRPSDVRDIVATPAGDLIDNAGKWARSRVRVRCEKADGRLKFRIEDDGPGLTAEQRGQVGNRGERLDETVQGSGLGLAIVRDISRLYGGFFALEASSLGGVMACLDLPAIV